MKLEQVIQRSPISIRARWKRVIEPTILAHLCGMSCSQWKSDFFQFVIDSKAQTFSDVDWNAALKRWPFATKSSLTQTIRADYIRNEQKPLYLDLESRMSKDNFRKMYIDNRLALINMYEDLKLSMN